MNKVFARIVSLLLAETLLLTSALPVWASPSEWLRPRSANPTSLASALKPLKDGGSKIASTKPDAFGKHIHLTNEEAGAFAVHHEIEIGSAEHNRLRERLRSFEEKNETIRALVAQLEAKGIVIRFSSNFGALGIRLGDTIYFDKHLFEEKVHRAPPEIAILLEGLLWQQRVHDSTLDFNLLNEFMEEVVAVMFESAVYRRGLRDHPDLSQRLKRFLQEKVGIQKLETVVTDELLGIAREMVSEDSALYSEEIGITQEGIHRLIDFVQRYYPEYRGLRLPSGIEERVSEKRDILLLQNSLAKMRKYHREELEPVGKIEPWDYVVLAAANREQRRAFEAELEYRKALGLFSPKTKFMVASPPKDVDTGTGGAVLHALRIVLQDIVRRHKEEGAPFHHLDDLLKNRKILIMLSGGPSKRIPIFSAVGKAFTPLPVPITGVNETELTTTLFDELYMMLSGAASKMHEGLIVIPGDAQIIFDWDAIALEGKGSEGLMEVVWRAPAEEAVTHGVRITGTGSDVMQFSVEKKSVEELRRMGAIDRNGLVNLSTALIKGDREVARRLAELGGLRVENGVLLHDRSANIVARTHDPQQPVLFDWFEDFLPALGEAMTKDAYVRGRNRRLRKSIWESFREKNPVQYHVRSTTPFLFADFGTTGQARDHFVQAQSRIKEVYAFRRWSNAHVATGAEVSGQALVFDSVILGLREFEVEMAGVPVLLTVDSTETIIQASDPTLQGATIDVLEMTLRKPTGEVIPIKRIKRQTYQSGFVGDDSIITMSQLSGDFKVGENSFVYMVDDPYGKLRLGDNIVIYQVPIRINGTHTLVNVVYGAQIRARNGKVVREADDPKREGEKDTLFGENLKEWLKASGISAEDMITHIWPNLPEERWSLWNAKLYAPGDKDFHLTNWMMEPGRRSPPARWIQMMKSGELLSMEEIARDVDYAALIARRKSVRENEFLRYPTYVDIHVQHAWQKALAVFHTVDYDPQDDTPQKGALVKMVPDGGARVGVGIGEDHTVIRTTDFEKIPLGHRFDPERRAILNPEGGVVANVLWIDETFRRLEITSRGRWIIRYDPRRDDPTKPKIPQIAEVMQPIIPGEFNFSKVSPLLTKPINRREFRIIATKVPIFRNAILFAGEETRPQVLLRNDIHDALAALRNSHLIVWFNSLGGAASVNDYHTQGVYREDLPLDRKELPVESAEVAHVANVGSVKIGYFKDWPAQGMVFTGKDEAPLAEVAYRYVNLLQEKNIPHNVIFFKEKIIVFIKNRDRLMTRLGINPAAPELSGLITLSDPKWLGNPPADRVVEEGLAEATVSQRELLQLLKEFHSRYDADEEKDVDELLQQALQSKKEGRIRRYLSQKLSQDGFGTTIAFLKNILETGEDRYHEGAIQALGFLGSESAIRIIKKFYKDPRIPVRVAVVKALGKVRGVGAIDELIEMLEDHFYGVYLEAAYLLGESGDAQATAALVRKLNEKKSGTLALKEKLARAIGKIGDIGEKGNAVKALIHSSHDSPYETLRRASVWALGEMNYGKASRKTDAAVGALKDRMLDERVSVRVEATKALQKIGEKYPELRKEVGESLVQRLDEEKDWQVRETIVRVLGKLPYERGVDRLGPILVDSNEDFGVRVAAVYALSQFIGDERTARYLTEAMAGVQFDEIISHREDDVWIAGHLDRFRRKGVLAEAEWNGLKVSFRNEENWRDRRKTLQQVNDTLEAINQESMVKELWERDGYWAPYEDKPERLGWQRLPDEMKKELEEIQRFVEEIKEEGMTDVVVIGMGGATQGIYTYLKAFGAEKGLTIHILDTTSPKTVKAVEERIPLEETLFIFSSKAGAVPEGNANFQHFWWRSEEHFGKGRAGKRFAAITNPDFPLDQLAKQLKFRKVFHSKVDIGGRFEALSMEMLVMAALMGVDVEALLNHVNIHMIPRMRNFVDARQNPAAQLAALLDVLRRRGVDKMTVLTSESLEGFKPWVEQLVSESLGKAGKGILPTSGEGYDAALAAEGFYSDRVFIIIQTKDEPRQMDIAKDISTIDIVLPSRESLGELFYLWEMVTALQGRLMNINPFSAPAVLASKQRTGEYLDALTVSSTEGSIFLDYGAVLKEEFGISESALTWTLERLGATQDDIAAVYAAILFLAKKSGREYATLLPYLPGGADEEEAWKTWRSMMHQMGFSTYTGEGPRFQHSALQFFMDGPNTGFHTMVAFDDDPSPLLIHDPARPTLTYGQFIRAQSLGTKRALEDADRLVVRFGIQESASSLQALRDLLRRSEAYLSTLLESEYRGSSSKDGGGKRPFALTFEPIDPQSEPSPFIPHLSAADFRRAIKDAFYNSPLLQETLKVMLNRPSLRIDEISEVTATFLDKEILMSRVYLVTVKHRYGKSQFTLDIDRESRDIEDEEIPMSHRVWENLREAYAVDPRYMVRPYAKGTGHVQIQFQEIPQQRKIAMATKEYLKGWDNAYLMDLMGERRRIRSSQRLWQIKEEQHLFMEKAIKILTLYYLKLGQRVIKVIFNHGDFMIGHVSIANSHTFDPLDDDYLLPYEDKRFVDLKGAHQNMKLVSIAGLEPMGIPEFVQYLLDHKEPTSRGPYKTIFDPGVVWKGIAEALIEIYGRDRGQEEFKRWEKLSSASKDGGHRTLTWPTFSFEGEEKEKGMPFWRGRLYAGEKTFSVFLGSAGGGVYLELHDPDSDKIVATSEWYRGEKPWFQTIAVDRPEFRGQDAVVRLIDVIMAIRLSDMAAHGSHFENLHSSVTLRPSGDRWGSLGVFRSLERIGLRPDSEVLIRWADRVKEKHAAPTLEHQLRGRLLKEDMSHLRISWVGGEPPGLFEEFEIELFLVQEDGRALEEEGVYQRLPSQPKQVEFILRRLALGAEKVRVEGRQYHVWVGGVEYKLNPEKLPELLKTVASLPRVPWAPKEVSTQDGGKKREAVFLFSRHKTKGDFNRLQKRLEKIRLKAEGEGKRVMVLLEQGGPTLELARKRHPTFLSHILMKEKGKTMLLKRHFKAIKKDIRELYGKIKEGKIAISLPKFHQAVAKYLIQHKLDFVLEDVDFTTWEMIVRGEMADQATVSAFYEGKEDVYLPLLAAGLYEQALSEIRRDGRVADQIRRIQSRSPESVVVVLRGSFHALTGMAEAVRESGVSVREVSRYPVKFLLLNPRFEVFAKLLQDQAPSPEDFDTLLKEIPFELLGWILPMRSDFSKFKLLRQIVDRFTRDEIIELSHALARNGGSEAGPPFILKWLQERGKITDEETRLFKPELWRGKKIAQRVEAQDGGHLRFETPSPLNLAPIYSP